MITLTTKPMIAMKSKRETFDSRDSCVSCCFASTGNVAVSSVIKWPYRSKNNSGCQVVRDPYWALNSNVAEPLPFAVNVTSCSCVPRIGCQAVILYFPGGTWSIVKLPSSPTTA